MRTRRIGGEILIDVHILVEPFISITEGHKIAEQVRNNLKIAFPNTQDTLVHVDADEDIEEHRTYYATSHAELRVSIDLILRNNPGIVDDPKIRIHHLGGKNIIELFLKTQFDASHKNLHQLTNTIEKQLESLAVVDQAKIH